MSWIMPFSDKAITGHYGTMSEYRRARNMQAHSGTDWSPAGSNKGKTPIPAIASGTIKLIQWSAVLGWVIVQTAMNKDRKVQYIGYCHVSCGKHGVNCKGPAVKCSSPVKKKVGDKLNAGDTVAIMGNTGSASSGVHLHATLGSTLKSVFGPTSAKADLYKAIKENAGVAPKKASVAPRPLPVPVPVPKDIPTIKKHLPLPPQITFYKVQPGDTLVRIATQNGTTVDRLAADNNIKNVNLIQVGQMIRIEK